VQTPSRFDAAILTVIPVEFRAVAKAFNIDFQQRTRNDGSIFYKTTAYSRLLGRGLRIIVGCVDAPSQANAGVMATCMIKEFDPALIILLGIGAGMRGKLKIGDIIVPRQVADMSVAVATPDGRKARPDIKSPPHPVMQMMHGFSFSEAAYHDRCRELFGPALIPTVDQEADFAKHVTFEPHVADNVLASEDLLIRDPNEFYRLIATHEGIRAADMEAGGFIKACETGLHLRPWLIVRGISDFGDSFKNDNFHRLAACAAAAWIGFFLEDGFDLVSLRPDEAVELSASTAGSSVTTDSPPVGSGILGSVATELINSQLEKLGRSLTEDRLKDFERIRDDWRIGGNKAALASVRGMKRRDDWRLILPEVRAKYLRFEASLVLALEKNIAIAKDIAKEAALADPAANMETLGALIAYHESGAKAALSLLTDPTTVEAWNIKLALLGVSDQWPAVLIESGRPPPSMTPNAETRRMRALGFLFSNNLAEARSEISLAVREAPDWFSIRHATAIIDYFECLSPAILKHVPKDWPTPIDVTLVRGDASSLAALRRAGVAFAALLARPGLSEDSRHELEGWRLACLANDLEKRNEAQKYCSELLQRDFTHPVALAWATARGYAADFSSSIDAFFSDALPRKK